MCLVFSGLSISYFPGLVPDPLTPMSSPIRSLILNTSFAGIALCILIKTTAVFQAIGRLRIIQVYIFAILLGLMFLPINLVRLYYDVYYFSLSFTAFLLGCTSYYKPTHIKIMFLCFSIATFICAFYQIDSISTERAISDHYVLSYKNSVCVIWALCAIGLFYIATLEKLNILNLIMVAFAITFLVFLVISRARAATLTAFLGIGFIFFRRYVGMTPQQILWLIILFIMAIFVVVAFEDVFRKGLSLISDSFFMGRDLSDIDSISSGRWSRNIIAIEEFLDNPFAGLLYTNREIPWVHFYLLKILSSFGIFFGMPFLVVYFYLLKYVIKGIIRPIVNYNYSIYALGVYLMGGLMFISLLEPSFPFGPSSITIPPMFFLGMFIKTELQ